AMVEFVNVRCYCQIQKVARYRQTFKTSRTQSVQNDGRSWFPLYRDQHTFLNGSQNCVDKKQEKFHVYQLEAEGKPPSPTYKLSSRSSSTEHPHSPSASLERKVKGDRR
ncbi:unnamed protein product, partial [Nesidiocoris tenuis]